MLAWAGGEGGSLVVEALPWRVFSALSCRLTSACCYCLLQWPHPPCQYWIQHRLQAFSCALQALGGSTQPADSYITRFRHKCRSVCGVLGCLRGSAGAPGRGLLGPRHITSHQGWMLFTICTMYLCRPNDLYLQVPMPTLAGAGWGVGAHHKGRRRLPRARMPSACLTGRPAVTGECNRRTATHAHAVPHVRSAEAHYAAGLHHRFTGCRSKECSLCKNNPHKRCALEDNFDECFADNQVGLQCVLACSGGSSGGRSDGRYGVRRSR